MSYTEPDTCLICKSIITFCECEKSIIDKDEYLEWLELMKEKLIDQLKREAE